MIALGGVRQKLASQSLAEVIADVMSHTADSEVSRLSIVAVVRYRWKSLPFFTPRVLAIFSFTTTPRAAPAAPLPLRGVRAVSKLSKLCSHSLGTMR